MAWPDPSDLRRQLATQQGHSGDAWGDLDPTCHACHDLPVVGSRWDATAGEKAAWPVGETFGYIACRTCHGTGLRLGAGRCDDCSTPVLDATDALCEDCKDMPRCSHCALRLDPDARDGALCDDCQRQARIDFETNLGDL